MPVLRECVRVADSKMMEKDAKPDGALQGRVALVTGAAKRNRGAIINFYGTCWGMCSGQSMPNNNGNLKRQERLF